MDQQPPPIVRIRDLSKDYLQGDRSLHVLRGLDLDVAAGEMVAIAGPSGSGKTTLFNLISGLDTPSGGSIAFEGREVTRLSAARRAGLRLRRIGTIFQSFHLLPHLSATENVMVPMLLAGVPRAKARDRAETLLARVGLADRRGHHAPELSGGQQQRVAVARALANDPVLILADEPTGNLDQETGRSIIELLSTLTAGFLVATHDPAFFEAADRVLSLRDGKLHNSVRG